MTFIAVSGWWQEFGAGMREDFSDLPSVSQVARIIIRLLLAAILGGLLGYQREQTGKAAGLRTHMLVALGAALFILVPQQSGVSNSDLTRVTQGIVAGIGFLGAGAILKQTEQGQIKGLTTAASIWMTAAIGVAAGMGREGTAVMGTVLSLVILAILPRFESITKNSEKA